MTFSARVYHARGRLFVHPDWRTGQGLDVPGAPVAVLDDTASDADLGGAVLEALAGYREGLPDEQGSLDPDDEPVLAAAGVRRMGAFVREAAFVWVWTHADRLDAGTRVEVDPSRRGRGAFDGLPEDQCLSAPAAPDGLGAAVREAFGRCVPPAELGSGAAGRGGAGGADPPVAFGPKTAWLAARSADPAAVARAVGLAGADPASWAEGVERAVAADDLVFVTPPVDGWVLAVGAALGGWWPHEIATRLAGLSRVLGEVHYYVTHRASDYAAWARADSGRTERMLAFGDELIEQGIAGEAERALGIDFEQRFPTEGDVFAVACAWSVDPTELDERDEPAGPGLLGRWSSA